MQNPIDSHRPCQVPAEQASLDHVVGEDGEGQRETYDLGPRVEAAPVPKAAPVDDQTLPLRWKPLGYAPGAAWRRKKGMLGRP